LLDLSLVARQGSHPFPPMVICFITRQWHQNHWNQHQKHLLLKLLLVLASEEQQHWRVWVLNSGGKFKETRRGFIAIPTNLWKI
jgi:hypothetical protein